MKRLVFRNGSFIEVDEKLPFQFKGVSCPFTTCYRWLYCDTVDLYDSDKVTS